MFCERTQSFLGECKCFTSERNRFARKRKFFVSECSFLGEYKCFTSERNRFLRKHKCFASESKVSLGNATVLSENGKFLGNTEVLQANAKFHAGMQYFCE